MTFPSLTLCFSNIQVLQIELVSTQFECNYDC